MTRRHRRRADIGTQTDGFQTIRQGALLIVWIALGLLSYGFLWLSITTTDDRSYLTVSTLNQQLEQSYQSSMLKRQAEIEQTKKERLRKRSQRTEQQQQTDKEHRWVAFGLWMTVIGLSYHRIRHNDNQIPHRYTHRNSSSLLQTRRINHETMVRTLRRINQERQARNEEIISMDAVEAFQRALMQDREIWQGLLREQQQQQQHIRNSNQGATAQQIQACPQRNATQQDDGECSICLSDLNKEEDVVLRSLPCGHSFHASCIDRWLEQSTLCPICKFSLQDI